MLRPPSLREALRARRSDAGGEFVSDAGSGSGILRLRLMGSPRKNGRLGDPALPSLTLRPVLETPATVRARFIAYDARDGCTIAFEQ
ncbi:MAG: hypothetical protein JO232_00635 [Verrucomicrobia bacterium]|nr:hypothetical protein [Verrucomicrobiota bacterium]